MGERRAAASPASRRSAPAIRCRCTAWGCRSGLAAGRLTAATRAAQGPDPPLPKAGAVSDTFAWSSHDDGFLADLLPLPSTTRRWPSSAAISTRRRRRWRRACCSRTRRPTCSSATARSPRLSSSPEGRPPHRLRPAARAFNNVFVSATNTRLRSLPPISRSFPLGQCRRDPSRRLRRAVDDEGAPLLIDAHNSPVRAAVWALYQRRSAD